MSTNEIATRLVELCGQGKWEAAQKELFAEDAVSIEPHATPAFEKETKGLNAIIEKGHKFEAMTQELHKVDVSEPIVTGNTIAFKLTMDITMKEMSRETWEEICVYIVKDGKIISEQFFL
ncbi:MAG TPA: nuclear transport factor 2 family protein [Flavisolibacter sp.]|nr:nuclear transport factor 2 family protein [Flavisolibacter sp.]